MKKNVLRKKFLSVLLAGALTVTSFNIVPPITAHAEKGEGTVTAKYSYDANYDNQYAYSGDDLGCTYTKDATTFKVWSPKAEKVVLCRYTQGNGGSLIEEVPMTKGDRGVWSITINKDIVNTYYTYKVTVDGTTKEAVDIYAKAAGLNGDRAMVVDLDSTDPYNWDKDYERETTNLSDIIVWEVHIRDFSIDVSSGVSEKNRGKYKAFTEDNTTVNGEGKVASCVNYLKQLGVTHVQLLPMYDYASVDEANVSTSLSSNYNWGYDPKNYNVPEGSYSSNPYDGNVRIKEMKEMIQALHDAGIKVVMDVVYNHTYDTADSNFNKIMPDYYYKINSDMTYNNQSGCGNATRSTSAMYRKFMVDSVSYWADEYNIDGFRFDLMGIHDYETMNLIRNTLDSKFGKNTIVMYGEGWTATDYDSTSAHKANESKLSDGIGYFNDQIRDAIKGEHKFDGTIGLVQTNYTSGNYLESEKWPNNVYGGIMGSVGYTSGQYGMWRPFWSKSSNCCISYTSAHDNLTLWDKLTEKFGKNYSSTDDKLLRMNKMSGSIILVSKGGAFMQAGEEFARTKNGDDNSYSSPDSVNKIDWNRVSTYSSIEKYYEGMIKIRKAFSGFRSITTRSGDNWNPNNNNLTWISKDVNSLIAFYETNNVKGEWNRIAVLINNSAADQTVSLNGSDNWVIIADGNNAGLTKLRESGSSVSVSAKSVTIAVPKDTFDACQISENKAPVIQANSEYTGIASSPLTFDIKATDADNDKITLTAANLPSGAEFNSSASAGTATGTFNWSKTVAGTYSFTVTATDGKTSVTKTITITITEKTDALKKLVSEVKAANYNQTNLSEKILSTLNEKLSAAEKVINSSETNDTTISTAYDNLTTAYDDAKAETKLRETVVDYISKADTRISEAEENPNYYDSEALNDLKAVNTEAKTFIKSAHIGTEYTSMSEDLKYAINACYNSQTNPVIRVKAADWSSPAVYVWKGSGSSVTKYSSDWPGTKLMTKDSDGWYVFELPEGTTGYNVIVNDGATGTATQTSDITGIAGNIDITVTSFTGKTCSYSKTESEIGSATPDIDKTALLSAISTAEKTIKDKPDNKYTPALKTAYNNASKINDNSSSTQVEINKATRTLKSAILDVLNSDEDESSETTTEPASSEDNTTKPDESTSPDETSTRPSESTTDQPVTDPTEPSSVQPSTGEPEESTSQEPTDRPTSVEPTDGPTSQEPTDKPTSQEPTDGPTSQEPTDGPTSQEPTDGPTSQEPTDGPTSQESTDKPTTEPTSEEPTNEPTSEEPTNEPTSEEPTTEPATKALKVTRLTVDTPSKTGSVGDVIEISAKTSGGNGKVKYRFCAKDSKGVITVIRNYSSSKHANWKPKKHGTYTLLVYAKDADGTIAKKSLSNYYVNKKLKITFFSLKPSSKKITLGKKVRLSMAASGGTGKYSYKFAYVKSGSGRLVTIKNFSSKTWTYWKPAKSGSYTLYSYVKDRKTSIIVKKTIANIKVKK